jgi:hypothetical protein
MELQLSFNSVTEASIQHICDCFTQYSAVYVDVDSEN